jgi:hypothetical protein
MDAEIIVALVSGAVALATSAVTLFSISLTASATRSVEREKLRLEEQQNIRAEQRSKSAQAERILERYREPLLRAVFDLQSRLYNTVKGHFLKYYGSTSYAVDNTLYVIAQYLAWVEIIRQEVQFLDLGEEEKNKLLNKHLRRIATAFRTDHEESGLRLFEGQQRAIGEIMIVLRTDGEASQRECMGYAAFIMRLQEPEFKKWFDGLRADIDKLAREEDDNWRPIQLQNMLIEFLDFLDEHKRRFPVDRDQLEHSNEYGMEPSGPS